MWPTICPRCTVSPFSNREGRTMCEYQYQRRSRRPLMTRKLPSRRASKALRTTTPVPAAAAPGGAELADRPTRPVRATHGEEVTPEFDASGLFLIPAVERHDDPVGPVSDRPAAIVQAVPPLHLIGARLDTGQLDPPHLLAPAGDSNRDIGRRRAIDPEVDPHAIDRIREGSLGGDGRPQDRRVIGGTNPGQ